MDLHSAIVSVAANPALMADPAVRVLLAAGAQQLGAGAPQAVQAATAVLTTPFGPAPPAAPVPTAAPAAPAALAAPVRVEMDLAQLSTLRPSSEVNPFHSVDRVLFGLMYGEGAHSWCAASNDLNQHVTFWFHRLAHVVGVSTAGRPDYPEWVTQYQVLVTTDGVTWRAVDNNRVFVGNTDRTTIVRHNFEAPVQALGLRIAIRAWNSHLSMRAAVHGWLL